MFIEIERMVRNVVVKLASQSSQQDKEAFIEEIVSDDDIQFHRSMINMDLDNHVKEQLLQQIVQLLVTIRRFSTAGAFVKQYDREIHKKINHPTQRT